MRAISAKIPEEIYNEMVLRVPEGDRSGFIRDAILEKLQKTPKPDRVLDLERRVEELEHGFARVRKYLSDLDLLTFHRGRIDPHRFCVDELDHKITDYLIHYRGATTPELAKYSETNRWLVLNRLKRMRKKSRKRLGKPIVDFYAGERSDKRRAWWINKELVDPKS